MSLTIPSAGALLLWFALFAPAALAGERPVLVLNDTNDAPFTNRERTGFLDMVAGEAFRRAGLELRLVKLPAERALWLVDRGLEDGDLTRIAGMEKRYPNLVRVPEKLLDWEFAAFSRDPAIAGSFEAIRGRSTGLIRGWKIYEAAMAGAAQVVAVEDAAQLFRLLDLGRIEVALYATHMGVAHVEARGIAGVHVLQPPLARREMFIYLHQRHAQRVPAIAAALRELKREGAYRALFEAKVRGVAGGGS